MRRDNKEGRQGKMTKIKQQLSKSTVLEILVQIVSISLSVWLIDILGMKFWVTAIFMMPTFFLIRFIANKYWVFEEKDEGD